MDIQSLWFVSNMEKLNFLAISYPKRSYLNGLGWARPSSFMHSHALKKDADKHIPNYNNKQTFGVYFSIACFQ